VITEKGNRIPHKSLTTTSTAFGKDGMKDFPKKPLCSKVSHFPSDPSLSDALEQNFSPLQAKTLKFLT
jgi:hypothetical protein